MTATIDLDHVAIGVSEVQPYLDLLIAELGGKLREGGMSVGFRALQVTLGAEGMTVELLEPWRVDENDFLARFLDRWGEGPHHLTFKVPDLAAEVDRLRSLGFDPVQIDMSNPMWMECFLMPNMAHGTVVQLAQSGFDDPDLAAHPEPEGGWYQRWWQPPPDAAPHSVTLHSVVVAAPDPEATVAFFRDVLGGSELSGGDAPAPLIWPGGGSIVVEQSDGAAGIDRLAIDGDRSWQIGSARFVPRS